MSERLLINHVINDVLVGGKRRPIVSNSTEQRSTKQLARLSTIVTGRHWCSRSTLPALCWGYSLFCSPLKVDICDDKDDHVFQDAPYQAHTRRLTFEKPCEQDCNKLQYGWISTIEKLEFGSSGVETRFRLDLTTHQISNIGLGFAIFGFYTCKTSS